MTRQGRDYIVEPLRPEHGRALARLFERCAVPCFCRYWHFSGDRHAWLDRCANRPDANQKEMLATVAESRPEMRGLVAVAAGEIAGWMKLCPAAMVPKLYDQKIYRGLPCFRGNRTGVYTVGCFLVDEAWRRRGVARSLAGEVGRYARALGATAVEAVPRRATEVPDAQMWTGSVAMLEAAGFRVVHDFGPYPVLRLDLS